MEGGEAVEDVEAVVGVGDLFVFEVPGAGMGDVDGAEASGEGEDGSKSPADHALLAGINGKLRHSGPSVQWRRQVMWLSPCRGEANSSWDLGGGPDRDPI